MTKVDIESAKCSCGREFGKEDCYGPDGQPFKGSKASGHDNGYDHVVMWRYHTGDLMRHIRERIERDR